MQHLGPSYVLGWGDEPPTHGECAEMMAAVEEILALEEAKWSAVAATRAAEGGVGSRGNGPILNNDTPRLGRVGLVALLLYPPPVPVTRRCRAARIRSACVE